MTDGKVVLVVEDEVALITIFTTSLERAGYTVLSATSGEKALEIVEERGDDIDLLLSDIVMPGMGGRELVWRLRQSHPHIKVILASGYTDAEGALQMIEDQEVAFVEKPVELSKLLQVVGEVLEE